MQKIEITDNSVDYCIWYSEDSMVVYEYKNYDRRRSFYIDMKNISKEERKLLKKIKQVALFELTMSDMRYNLGLSKERKRIRELLNFLKYLSVFLYPR